MGNEFEEMKLEEMELVEGGSGLLLGVAIGFIVDGIIIATTGKSGGELVADGIEYVGNKIVEAYNCSVVY